jgi:hypothetical protein
MSGILASRECATTAAGGFHDTEQRQQDSVHHTLLLEHFQSLYIIIYLQLAIYQPRDATAITLQERRLSQACHL